jgi:hypothetical protein
MYLWYIGIGYVSNTDTVPSLRYQGSIVGRITILWWKTSYIFRSNMLDAGIFTSRRHDFLEETEQMEIHQAIYNYIAYLWLWITNGDTDTKGRLASATQIVSSSSRQETHIAINSLTWRSPITLTPSSSMSVLCTQTQNHKALKIKTNQPVYRKTG